MLHSVSEILQDLCLTPAPSGFEKEIAEKMYGYFNSLCDHVERDWPGNVIGRIDGQDPTLKPLMINAHMDRVGFIVSMITEEGFLKLKKIGTPNEKVLPGSELWIRNKDGSHWLPAVVGTKCAHLQSPKEQRQAEPVERLFIDIGAESAASVRDLGIEIGCPCVYRPNFSPLGYSRVCATALDNCGCLTALVKICEILHEKRPPRTVYIVANVWEEHSQRGAAFVARKINPVAVISMDMLLSGDTPDILGYVNGGVGRGPVVSCFNFYQGSFNGTIGHEGLLLLAETVGKEQKISTQRYVCDNSLGDNAYSQLEGEGPAVIEIGAAVRYAHSSGEVADLKDIEQIGYLVAGMALEINEHFKQARF